MRIFVFVALTLLLSSCAKPRDPKEGIASAVLILLCRTEPGSTDSRIVDVLKDSTAGSVRVSPGMIVTTPLVNNDFVTKYPLRVIFFEPTDAKFMEQFSGPRWESPVVKGRVASYNLPMDDFRALISEEGKRPNKAPEPTPGSVTPRATHGSSK